MNLIQKIWYIFDRRQKSRIAELVILILLGTAVETIGVTAIVPFISAIMFPDKIMSNPIAIKLCRFLGINDATQFIILLSGCLMVVYIVKNGYLCFMHYAQNRFIYNNQRQLEDEIMRCHLTRPYSYHLQHNSAELINNMTNDIDYFFQFLVHVINLFTDLFVSLALMILLFVVDKSITLAVFFMMLLFVAVFYKKYKVRLKILSDMRRHGSIMSLQMMQQAFNAIKDIRIAGRESFFLKANNTYYGEYTESRRKVATYSAFPKPILETICVITLLSVISLKIARGIAIDYFVPTLSVFALAVIRMLPSTSRIAASLNSISYSKTAVDVIYNIVYEMRTDSQISLKEDREKAILNDRIVIQGLDYRYEGSDVDVLKNIELEIPKNASVAFIGASGAGKTTLADLILGVLDYDKGSVLIDGIEMKGIKRKWQNIIGYIPQDIYIIDDSIRRNVAFGYGDEEIDDTQVWKVLEQAQVADFVRSLPQGLDTVIGEMGARISGGQKQRIGIARALYSNPEVLVLDEATSALDGDTESAVMEAIDALNGTKTLIIIAHRLSTIENCNIVYRIENGKATRER